VPLPSLGVFRDYASHEVRPVHPVTGVAADYYYEDPEGKRHPRWRPGNARPKSADPNKCWYSVTEVAQLLGRHPVTVRGWIKSGALEGHRPRIGDKQAQWLISGAAVEKFVRGQTVVAPLPARITAT
jgi:excisionase family DNA binding protein